MTGLLIIMFVPVFNSYKADPAALTDLEKHDLETYRMKWLLGALAIVVISLLFSNYRARKNPMVGELCDIRNLSWACLEFLCM